MSSICYLILVVWTGGFGLKYVYYAADIPFEDRRPGEMFMPPFFVNHTDDPKPSRWAGERPRSDTSGFTLVEVLVAGFVLMVGLIFIAQFFSSAISSVTDSETRSLIHQVASQEIEDVRAMDYGDIGTVGGHPSGSLRASETTTVEGVSLLITREVIFVEDASYSGPFPANYRRVTIRVQVNGDSRLGPVELATLVAGGAAGGSLDITVTNTRGDPVPDVLITVRNDHLSPAVLIDSPSIRTDSSGHLLIPGLTPDATTAYYVEVNKAGYNSAWTDPMVVVNEGLPYTVISFTIDQLSTLNIHVEDETGAPVPNTPLTVTGPREFGVPQTYVTDAGGLVSLVGIGYSTSGNPYVITVPAGGGHQAGSLGDIVLEPGTTQDVTITVLSDGATTTIRYGSLVVRVWRIPKDPKDPRKAVKNAAVTFREETKPTNDGGETEFSNVPFGGTYALRVETNDFKDYNATVTDADLALGYIDVILEEG